MKRYFLCCIILACSLMTKAQSSPQFTVGFSEPFAVYQFLAHLSPAYPDNPYRKAFEASGFHNEQYRRLIARFDSLDLYQSYAYQSYPYGQKVHGSTLALLKHYLIENSNIEGFRRQAIGVIPNSELMKLSELLQAFIPVYRQVIFEPRKDAFEKQLYDMQTYLDRKDVSAYFRKGLYFYNAPWPADVPFRMALLPMPGKGGFTAEAFLNNAASEVPEAFKSYDVLMGVLMHEIYHILYDEQPLEVKNQIAQWFGEGRGKTAQYAYLLLNEALATAAGNGFVYESLTGKKDTADWYDTKYINGMAKEIYPMVKEYLAANRPIDRDFVSSYVQRYEQRFPVWTRELDNLLKYRFMVADNEDDLGYLQRRYFQASASETAIPLSEMVLERMQRTPITKLIVLTDESKNKLGLVRKYFPEVPALDLSGEFVKTYFLEDKTWLILINRKTGSVEELMKRTFPDGAIKG